MSNIDALIVIIIVIIIIIFDAPVVEDFNNSTVPTYKKHLAEFQPQQDRGILPRALRALQTSPHNIFRLGICRAW